MANDPSVRQNCNASGSQLSQMNLATETNDNPDDSLELDELAITKLQQQSAPQLSNQISSKGVGIGYAAAFFVQVLSIGILLVFSKFNLTNSKTLPMRVVLLLVGLGWASFTVPTAIWLRKRPGPPLPSLNLSQRRWLYWTSYVSFAWLSLWKTVKVAVQLREVVTFLIAWFLLSDAVATVSGTAILFARTELRMGTAAVAMLSITATTSGILGAFLWPRISKRFRLQSNQTIIACILLFEMIPLYGLLVCLPTVAQLRETRTLTMALGISTFHQDFGLWRSSKAMGDLHTRNPSRVRNGRDLVILPCVLRLTFAAWKRSCLLCIVRCYRQRQLGHWPGTCGEDC